MVEVRKPYFEVLNADDVICSDAILEISIEHENWNKFLARIDRGLGFSVRYSLEMIVHQTTQDLKAVSLLALTDKIPLKLENAVHVFTTTILIGEDSFKLSNRAGYRTAKILDGADWWLNYIPVPRSE